MCGRPSAGSVPAFTWYTSPSASDTDSVTGAGTRCSDAGPRLASSCTVAGWPGSTMPGWRQAGSMARNRAGAGSGDWSLRSCTTPAAVAAFRARVSPVPPSVSAVTGVAPRTPGAAASRPAALAVSGLTTSTRVSAPALNAAWSAAERAQLWCWDNASVPVATASTISSAPADWLSGRPAQLPAADRGGQPPAPGRQPVGGPGGGRQQAQRQRGAAGQRQGRGQDQHRVDAAGAVGRRDHGRVVPELPASQHGQRDQGQVRAGPGNAGDGRLPAAALPSGTRGQRAQRRPEQHQRGPGRGGGQGQPGAGGERGQPQTRRVQRPGRGQQDGQPGPGQATGRGRGQAQDDRLGRVEPGQLGPGRAPRGEQRRLAFTLVRQVGRGSRERRRGDQRELEGADHEQRAGHRQAGRGRLQHRREVRGHLQAGQGGGVGQGLAQCAGPVRGRGELADRDPPGVRLGDPAGRVDGQRAAERGRADGQRADRGEPAGRAGTTGRDGVQGPVPGRGRRAGLGPENPGDQEPGGPVRIPGPGSAAPRPGPGARAAPRPAAAPPGPAGQAGAARASARPPAPRATGWRRTRPPG